MQPSDQNTCPTCHAPIPEDAPEGLCPVCSLVGAASVPPTTLGRQTPPPSIEEIAPHFPDLEILELLGAGGMGAVYKARQPQLDRFVAVKILSHELAQDPAFVERFNREAKVLARLSHPNIVAVFDFGTAGPYCYLLMEYVDGVNLRQAMRTGGFTPSEALALVQEICSALQFAHEEGILHRDIKPENVLIDSKGRVKIADFGIAKMLGPEAASNVTLTLQGSILGSPHYMAPEQIETPGDVDQRADIYSLGVVLYEMLTGELPIGRFDLPSEKAAIDKRIDEIVLRTLAKERETRYQSAGELGTQVATVAGSAGTTPPPQAEGAGNAGATPLSEGAGTAGSSLASAIFTGTSLVVLLSTAMLTSGSIFAYKVTRLIGAIGLTLSAGLAIVGIILGAVALGAIRRSSGRKSGLGMAVFGTTAWPILMLPFISSFFLAAPMPESGGRPSTSFGGSEILVLTWLQTLFVGFVLIRTLRRWAGGVPRKDGGRDFPSMKRGLALVAVVIPVVPILLLVAQPPGEEPRHPGLEAPELPKVAPYRNKVDWHRGAPEVLVPIKIHDAYRAEFRLALYDGEGNFQKGAEIGSWTPFLKRKDLRIEDIETCLVKVGTTPSEDQEGHRGITAIVESNGARGTLVADTDFAEWDFDCDELNLAVPHLPLTSAGSYAHTLAKREEEIDGKTKRTGRLQLEVQLIER